MLDCLSRHFRRGCRVHCETSRRSKMFWVGALGLRGWVGELAFTVLLQV